MRDGQIAAWLGVLRCLVMVRDQPIKVNQSIILDLLLQEQDRTLNLTGTCSSTGRSRLTLMEEREHEIPRPSVLRYHVTCVQLLADCCMGLDQANKQKCRALLPMERVVRNILGCAYGPHGKSTRVTADVVHYVRRPFISFLTQVCVQRPASLGMGRSVDHRRMEVFAGCFQAAAIHLQGPSCSCQTCKRLSRGCTFFPTHNCRNGHLDPRTGAHLAP